MKTWLRRGLWVAGGMLLLGAAAVAWGVMRSDQRMSRQVDQPAYALAVPEGAAALARGRYLFMSRGCAECHGANGAGHAFIDDPKVGMYVRAPNISPRAGSVTAGYSTADWERVVRHGIKPNGQPVMIMPSEDYSRFTDADVSALVAYVRTLPAVEGGPAQFKLPTLVRVLYGFGVIRDAAEKIDHRLAPAAVVPEGVSIQHGRYVAQMCVGCHGEGLSGGKIPGAPPDWPAAANLTPGEGSVLPRYASAESFRSAMRAGQRPDGSRISSVMPFASLREMSDVDLDAIHVYLASVPARPAGQR